VTVVRLPNYEDIRDDDNHVVDFSGDATD
jgi:hypothetical protein